MRTFGPSMLPSPVPGRTPFSRQPLRWASPPARGQVGAIASPGPGMVQTNAGEPTAATLSSISFAFRGTGVIGTGLTGLALQASIGFAQPVIIIGVTLACSIVNADTAEAAAVVVHKDVGPIISLVSGFDFFSEHIVEQGLSHSIRTGVSFSENIAPAFGTSDRMAIYAFMADAANAFTAMVSIRYVTTV